MNACKYCGKPATIHVTDILQKQKRETHVCDACAKAKHIIPDKPGSHIDLQGLVKLVIGAQEAEARGGPETPGMACPVCKLKFAEFRAEGRLGCSRDYDEFAAPLVTLLERVHRATEHCGKVPATQRRRMGLMALKFSLAVAIAGERYEEAAALRDRIREKEGADEPR